LNRKGKQEREKKNIGYDKTSYLRISSGQVDHSPGSGRRLIEWRSSESWYLSEWLR